MATIQGTSADDTLGPGPVTGGLDGGTNDSIAGLQGDDLIFGGGGNDTILGGPDRDSLYGGSGNDLFIETTGNFDRDLIFGGDGIDTVDYSQATIDGGGGINASLVSGFVNPDGADGVGNSNNDTLSSIENLIGSIGNDSIIGNGVANLLDGRDGNDSIFGGDGNDTLLGGLGNDSLNGGANDDSILGEAGNDSLVGDTGNDSLYGGEDNDTLRGESGDDFLDGGNGRDSLFGGSGDDTMRGGAGADSFDGGTGQDLADYSGSTAGVNASLQTGTGVGGDAEGDRYSGTDGFIGSGQNDTLTGFDGFQRPGQNITDVFTNLIRGEGGDDIISGLGGPDSLFGGTGNDTIYGGSSIPGTENSSAADSNDLIGGGEGNDLLFGDLGNDTITGDAGSDRIFGGNNNDSLSGGADNDTLGGDAGNDRLAGGTGDDSLSGGAGSDSLRGDEGDDTLTGGSGTDSMFGGDGNDLFVYEINDILGGITETVDGGGVPFPPTGAPDPNDFDILDLREYGETYGWGQVRVAYTGNDPRSESGTVSLFDQNGLLIGFIDFVEIEKVICFTPGTMILTDRGERPVEDLLADDLVMTRDNGLQPLRWVGRRHLSRLQLIADPDLQPVRIARDALRGDGPVRSMMVSPQHRVLVTGARAELLFGADEVLVPAKHLVGQLDATQVLPAKGVTYIHILFDRHEIVQSDGIWTESFQPAARSLNLMEAAVRQEILKIFPELATDTGAYTAARPSLKAHEARVLFAR